MTRAEIIEQESMCQRSRERMTSDAMARSLVVAWEFQVVLLPRAVYAVHAIAGLWFQAVEVGGNDDDGRDDKTIVEDDEGEVLDVGEDSRA